MSPALITLGTSVGTLVFVQREDVERVRLVAWIGAIASGLMIAAPVLLPLLKPAKK